MAVVAFSIAGCARSLQRISQFEHNAHYVIAGRGNVPALSFHRPSQHAHHRNRSREPASQRHGALDFHDPPLWRHVVAGSRRPRGRPSGLAQGRHDPAVGARCGRRLVAGFGLANRSAQSANQAGRATSNQPFMKIGEKLLRALLWVATHTLYRTRTLGAENVPATGGALLVCNHLSLVDALLFVAAIRRPVRFIMYKGMYEKRWIKPFAHVLRAIPISSELRPREM